MDTLVTFAAQYMIYIIGLSVLAYFFLRLPRGERKTFVLMYGVGILAAFIMVKVAGSIYYNPRPFVDGGFTPLFPHNSDNGFPSNHTVAAVLLATLLWRYSRQLSVSLILAACLVGLARVIANVHHIEDIVGSIVIAGLSVYVAHLVQIYSRKIVEQRKYR